jgi:hypothetical protein
MRCCDYAADAPIDDTRETSIAAPSEELAWPQRALRNVMDRGEVLDELRDAIETDNDPDHSLWRCDFD